MRYSVIILMILVGTSNNTTNVDKESPIKGIELAVDKKRMVRPGNAKKYNFSGEKLFINSRYYYRGFC